MATKYGTSKEEEEQKEEEKKHNHRKHNHVDDWNVPGGKPDPGRMAMYNDYVREHPLMVMLLTLVIIVIAGICECLRDSWSALPYYGEAVALEAVLSLDNIVVFHQIFEGFNVPSSRRPSILLIGTPIMILVRMLLFFFLRYELSKFWPAFIAIGLYLAYQGWQTMMEDNDDDDGEEDESATGVINFINKCCQGIMTKTYHGSALVVKEETKESGISKTVLTPVFACLLAIEACDVIFCVDGVATIYQLDSYKLWAAILGDITSALFVRSCYPVVGNAVNIFPDVKYSVGITLIAVGVDMILDAFHLDLPAWTLGALMPTLFVIGIASSIIRGGGTTEDLSRIFGGNVMEKPKQEEEQKETEEK